MSINGISDSAPLPWSDGVYSVKRFGVTITNCDSEPVQTPGCVQANGVIVVLRLNDLTILQASENLKSWFGKEPGEVLGSSATALFSSRNVAKLVELISNPSRLTLPVMAFRTVGIDDRDLAVSVHILDGLAIAEIELADTNFDAELGAFASARAVLSQLKTATTLKGFCQIVCDEVRELAGLDRVMVYRFLPDDSGQVYAEAKRDDLDPYLDLHYPASDIPKPAREIFKKIGIRPLPDATAEMYEMVPLVNPDTGRALNMTYCALRGASVMYTEYLQNMGVSASLTMPLKRKGELWGLIAGHQVEPRNFTFELRAACELIGEVASLQFEATEVSENLERQRAMDLAQLDLLRESLKEESLTPLANSLETIRNLFEADGVAYSFQEELYTAGEVPDEQDVVKLIKWLRLLPESGEGNEIFQTDELASARPEIFGVLSDFAGLLAVPMSRFRFSYLLLFRKEHLQTVSWAGDPYAKEVKPGPFGPRLTPRESFAIWQESVRGKSRPWTAFEITALEKLRRSLVDVALARNEQLTQLNKELERSNEELDAFAFVASHDLKEPLRGIKKYGEEIFRQAIQADDAPSLTSAQAVIRLTGRMDVLLTSLLHYARLGRGQLLREISSVAELVEDAVDLLSLPGEEASIRISEDLPSIACDPIRVREIYMNLIGNSIKYNINSEKIIEVGWIKADDISLPHIFFVKDNGIGVPEKHLENIFTLFRRLHGRDAFGGGSGAGLTIVKRLVEQHGGKMWVESTENLGTTFYFTLLPELSD